MKKIPINWKAIAAESGMSRGKLCFSTFVNAWVVQNTYGIQGQPDLAVITPPTVAADEYLFVKGNHWYVRKKGNKT